MAPSGSGSPCWSTRGESASDGAARQRAARRERDMGMTAGERSWVDDIESRCPKPSHFGNGPREMPGERAEDLANSISRPSEPRNQGGLRPQPMSGSPLSVSERGVRGERSSGVAERQTSPPQPPSPKRRGGRKPSRAATKSIEYQWSAAE